MKKKFIIIFVVFLLAACTKTCMAESEHFQIKMGAHEKSINSQYGNPIIEEKLNEGFLPINKKKALYKIDDENYFIIKYFSGRVKNIDILEEFEIKEAKSEFQKVK